VAALLIVISVMSGFQEDIRQKILGMTAHIQLYPLERGLPRGGEVADAVERVPGVVAASPFIVNQVMLTTPASVTGAVVYGIDPARAGRVTNLAEIMRDGRLADLRSGEIILGEELARSLGVVRGSQVNVVSPTGQLSPIGMVPRARPFRVVGIFRAGNYEYDSGLAFITIADAQSFFDMDGRVTGVEMRVDDIYATRDISAAIETDPNVRRTLEVPFITRDWQERNKNLFSALKLEKTAMFIILTLIVLVAAFNIVSTLIMVVMEKTKDIAILKAMGATDRSVMRIFVLEGVIIGVVGTTVGLLLGVLGCQLVSQYPIVKLDPQVYMLSRLPAKVEWVNVLLIAGASLSISALATLYPAWQAARLDPVEAIRYE
jgi:lipoprotein-releasing system permease protein